MRIWHCIKEKWIEDEQGAVVVEATISLTTFVFAILTVLSIINIALAQAKVGIAICGVAEDLSKVSYLYEMSGIAGKREDIEVNSRDAKETISDFKDAVANLDLDGMTQVASKLVEDDEIWTSFVRLIETEAGNKVSSYAMSKMCDCLVKVHMGTKYSEAGNYLKSLGVVDAGGTATGLDFSKSVFCNPNAGDSDDIIVVVQYKIHVIKLLGINIEYDFQQCAATKAWKAA